MAKSDNPACPINDNACTDVHRWNLPCGAIARLGMGRIGDMAVSPDGRWIAIGGASGVWFYDADTYEVVALRAEKRGQIQSVAFSPDSTQFVTGDSDGQVNLWDFKSGENLAVFSGHIYYVQTIAFSSDGKYIASGSNDQTVRLWDVASGKNIQTFIGHTGIITSVVFSPDGSLIASGSRDQTVKLWVVSSGKCVASFNEHTGPVEGVAFSPDGSLIASGSRDQTVKLWDVKRRCHLTTLKSDFATISLAFLPNGEKLFIQGLYEMKVWAVKNSTTLATRTVGSGVVWSVTFSSDGRRIASGNNGEKIQLWDIESGKNVYTWFKERHGWMDSVAFSPDGSLIVSGNAVGKVELWDVETGSLFKTLMGHQERVYAVAFSPGGRCVVSGSRDKTVKLWDAYSGETLKTFEGHTHLVKTVTFSPDGHLIASGGYDGTTRLWTVKGGECIATFKHLGHARSVAFSPDSALLAGGLSEGAVNLWHIGRQQPIAQLSLGSPNTRPVNAIAFSPCGRFVVSGENWQRWDKRCAVRLWEVETEQNITLFCGHTSDVQSVAFSSDGQKLASGGYDGQIFLWDMTPYL